jgi:hypothetical protein
VLGIVTPTWRPGEAYFAGKEGEKPRATETKPAESETGKPAEK